MISISADLRSLDDYVQFRRSTRDAFLYATEKTVRERALSAGTRTALLGRLGPEATEVGRGDLREQLLSGGLSSRHRAIGEVVFQVLDEAGLDPERAKIFGHEATTAFGRALQARFEGFCGIDYPSPMARPGKGGQSLDIGLSATPFPDDSLDLIISSDVLELAADRDLALEEAARTLRESGVLIATLPFDFDSENGWLFASIRGDDVVHLIEAPIFHGSALDPAISMLVFEIPGWSILRRAKAAGFGDAFMRFICDEEKGITASTDGRPLSPRGVFVLICRKRA